MNPLKGKAKILAIASIVLIIVISYSLFFYLQSTIETNTRNSIFEHQKALQMQSTQALSQRIGSDLSFMMSKLQGLADSSYLQQADLSSDKTKKLSQEIYFQINNVTTADRLFIINKNCVVMTNISPLEQKTFVGSNVSGINWIRETTITHKPIFSNGYTGLDGKYRIAISYPIINRETREYIGLVGFSVPAAQLFEHYGNIFDIKSQYLAVLDRNSDQLIHPLKSFIGKPFFGDYTQQVTGNNNALNSLIRAVMDGKSDFAAYNFKNGDRLNTGFPIFLEGKPTYFVFVITPMSIIYSQIDKAMSIERMEMFSLLVGTTAAIVMLVIFLIRWSSTLDNEVKRRTKELETANKQLSLSNEQLKLHDKAQQEFINVAAHELRTPIQPIIALSDVLLHKIRDGESRELIDGIFKSAKRLQRLSQDILDITRIESGLLKLNKEYFDLKQVISNTVDDYENQIKNSNKNVRLVHGFDKKKINQGEVGGEQEQLHKQMLIQDNTILIEADKVRITQVIDNLLSNALKFTEEGTISVLVESNDREAVVSVEDDGQGIDPEILPKLFTKFATSSSQGIGLGLYISKSIVEAHGGKMWAESNKDTRGATFSFSLPLANNNNNESYSNGNSSSSRLP
jgi:signal transduction histidine kinase